MPVRVVTSAIQQPLTVNALVQNPLIIPERIIKVLDNQFVMNQVLRNAGKATGGAVSFRIATGLFADDTSEVVAPAGEIPLVTVTRGDLDSARVKKRALGVEIDREMRERNDIGAVQNQLTRLRNTLVRDFDGAFVTTLRNAVTQTVAATTVWATSTTIRKDIIAAKALITNSQAPNTTGGQQFMGYQPDAIVFNPNTANDLIGNTNFLQLVLGTTAPTNTSSLPAQILGLTPRLTWGVPNGEAWVMESGTVGGYADEIPLEATELYYWQPRQVYRSDTTRATAGFIDNPAAEGEVFEANSQEEYDRLIDIGAALDPDEAQKQEKAQLDERLAALDAEKAQLDDRRKAIQAEAAAASADDDPANLKGKALEDALDAHGLSKDGTADEKRARLADHLQAQE
jgi:hypothetical protein